MVRRPHLALSIVDLEKIFEQKGDSPSVLAELIVELAHRDRPRAKRLNQKVLRALSEKKPAPRRPNFKENPEKLLTVEEHRRVAAHLRSKHIDWTPEEQKVALDFAKQHEFLADLIERRSGSLK